jgi:hypothetical protein
VEIDGPIPGFVGFRRWLKDRGRVLHVREGKVRQTIVMGQPVRRIARVDVEAVVPAETRIEVTVRTRTAGRPWSRWTAASRASELPPGIEAQVEVLLHTDDGYHTPAIRGIRVEPMKG